MTTTNERADAEAPAHTGRIGVVQASALYIAAVLGTGILVLPGLASEAAGPASILAVAAVFLLSIPLASTFGALAARYPDAGGVATFVRLALGDTAARMAGYWFLFGVQFGAPVVATLGAEYLASAIGADRSVVWMIALAFLAVPLGIGFFGLRVSGKVQLGLTGLLVVVVLGVVAVTAPDVRTPNFEPFLPHGWAGVATAISLFVWAFAGWEAVTHIAGEFRNPRRTIPIATAVAVVVVGAAYLALQVVTVGVLGGDGAPSVVPLIDLVAVSVPEWGPAVVAAIAAVVALGVLNAYVPAFANLAASLGRDGHLPRWFGKGAEAGAVPRRALALIAVIELAYFGIAASRGLDLTPFILIHTSSMVAVYVVGSLAAVRLLARFSLGWWMAVVSLVLTVGLLVLAGANLLIPALLAVIAVVVTVVRIRRRTRAQ
ncbi:amino acid permease [Antiquaquibacter oligotrophicus]|uniref:APC family permease n=1 Tax=Antiquaquibacter oligotrophicus TaxID=2880260 RepID=UPI002AC9E458|nr:amino acid permease [Antiquaquibacter oligotrophicus]UDF12406.1 amino acid permease [Antiquaquibacter oligotrophicus]